MDATHDPLWHSLASFELDPADAALGFTQRLARENGWSHGFATRVVREYKKFIFLVVRAGHPVTPSDQVDQAWHLHLAYTRSYWDELCGGILRQPLHHGPTRGGSKEDAKFHDWYGRTKHSYERWFGTLPPADIWPPHEERFDPRRRFRRVDTGSVWMLSKASARRVAIWTVVGAVLVAAYRGGLASVERSTEFLRGDLFAVILIALLAIVVFAAAFGRRGRGKGGGSGCSTACNGTSCGSSGHGGDGHSGCGSHDGGSGCGSSGCGGGGGCGSGGD